MIPYQARLNLALLAGRPAKKKRQKQATRAGSSAPDPQEPPATPLPQLDMAQSRVSAWGKFSASASYTVPVNIPNGHASPDDQHTETSSINSSAMSLLLTELRSITTSLRTHRHHSEANFEALRTQLDTYGDRVAINHRTAAATHTQATRIAEGMAHLDGNFQSVLQLQFNSTQNSPTDGAYSVAPTHPNVHINQLTAEIEDRLSRSRNLLLFNVRQAEEAGLSDTDTVVTLSRIDGVSTRHISVRRRGSVQGTDPRPLQVVLGSQERITSLEVRRKFK